MTEAFQLGLLSYLVQSSIGTSYIEAVNDDTFDILEFKLTSQLLKRYHHLHQRLPGELEASAFLEETLSTNAEIPANVAKDLREVFEDLYVPLNKKDFDYIEDQLIINLQDKQIEAVTSRFAKGEISNKEFFDKLAPISALALPGEEGIFDDSGFLIADRDNHSDEQIEGEPTFLHDINKLTAAGGFYSPQLIVLMSGPKHFKTGIMIRLAIEYARDGYSVYYADIENGARAIRNRSKMAIMNCELHELFDGTIPYEDIDTTMELFGRYMGGDIFIDNYPAYSKTMVDIENRLAYLKENYGFEPNIIFYDPLDKFIPIRVEDQKREPRIQSQKVYHESQNLNKKLKTFAFTPSQVNRNGISKKTLSMTDIAEDFGKVMIAHAIFAICATDEEMDKGIRRIIPVAQREGASYKGKNQCLVHIDEKTMLVEEAEIIDDEDVEDE